jgi:hypothetical protein
MTFFYFLVVPRFHPSQRIAMSGMSVADPHKEDGAFGAGVGAGLLGVGWVVAVGWGVLVGIGEDVGRGVLDNVGVVGRRVFVGAGVFVGVGGYARFINSRSV